MPGGDGTGPMGFGPMTGRSAGFCAGYAVPGYMNSVPGRGFWVGGRGRGGGRGWGRGGGRGWARFGYMPTQGVPTYAMPYTASPYPGYGADYLPQATPQQELDGLKGQAEYFEDVLDGIRKRITELEAATVKEK